MRPHLPSWCAQGTVGTSLRRIRRDPRGRDDRVRRAVRERTRPDGRRRRLRRRLHDHRQGLRQRRGSGRRRWRWGSQRGPLAGRLRPPVPGAAVPGLDVGLLLVHLLEPRPLPGRPPGVSVGAEGSFEIERTDTTLDAEGCPTQTLSVTGRLELQTTASGETPVASGELKSYLGEATTYSVTVPSDAADAIESGDRSVPNPIDPRTIQAGESVELSQEFYAGNGQKGSYRALQLELGYDEGKRVSAGVRSEEHTSEL